MYAYGLGVLLGYMPLGLALLSAMVLGAADFVGGCSVRRSRASAVIVWSNGAGLLVALALALTAFPGRPRPADLGWAALAGIIGSLGAALLYQALASGVMTLVAPTTAAAAAIVPVVAGLAFGQALSRTAGIGVVCALLSVVLISAESGLPSLAVLDPRGSRAFAWALLAGLSFGVFLVLIAQTAPDSGFWPMVSARTASLSAWLLLALVQRRPLGGTAPALALAALSGVLDMAANGLYLVAVRGADLAVVGLLASLSPLGTVVLARLVLGERLRVPQQIGAALALGSVVLLALR